MRIFYKNGDIINNCTFINDTTVKVTVSPNGKWNYLRYAKFKCFCGKEFECLINSLRRNKTKSCGCLRIKELKNKKQYIKHGNSRNKKKSAEYTTWLGMKARCKETNVDRNIYFDKGIKVCDRWIDSFENFIEDMGKRPSNKHSLDRIDGNKGYFKENCRWGTIYDQSGNKSSNIMISFNDQIKCMGYWAKEYNIKYSTFKYRLKKGWSMERAIIPPSIQKDSFK